MKREIDIIETFLKTNREISKMKRLELHVMVDKIKNPEISIGEKLFFWEKLLNNPGILNSLNRKKM